MNKSFRLLLFVKVNLILLCLLFQTHAFGQIYNFNHYSLKDGLIQSNVNDILQDHDGYLWFATDGGLSKFNGKNFTNYSTNEGLSEASVNTICEDNKGNIWIGHSYGKISVYDGKKFKNFDLKLTEKPGRITDIIKDNKGYLWISTIGSGVLKVNPENNELQQYSISKNLSDLVFMSFIDASGKTWFVTDIGIKYYDTQKDSFIFFKPKGFPFFEYSCMTQDQNGNFWFGTANQGLVYFNMSDSSSTNYSTQNGLRSNFITGILSNQDHIWAATWEGGIVQVKINKNKSIISLTDANGLQSNKIRSLFIDRESTLWAGMQDKGIAQFKGFKFIHFNDRIGIKNSIINCVTEDDNGNIWLGTNEGIDIVSVDQNYTLKKNSTY